MRLAELFIKKKPAADRYYEDSTQKWLPVRDVKNGIVILKDGRYVKVLEVLSVNFYLKSETEQQNIIYYFASYLKVAPDHMQIRVLTQKAEISDYLDRLNGCMQEEQNEACRRMIADEMSFVEGLSYRMAVKKRFFIVFGFEPRSFDRTYSFSDAVRALENEGNKARRYLAQCGLEVLEACDDTFLTDLFYTIINKKTGTVVRPGGIAGDMTAEIHSFVGGF